MPLHRENVPTVKDTSQWSQLSNPWLPKDNTEQGAELAKHAVDEVVGSAAHNFHLPGNRSKPPGHNVTTWMALRHSTTGQSRLGDRSDEWGCLISVLRVFKISLS